MLRFIFRRRHRDNIGGCEWEEFETLVADVPEVEAAMLRGGQGPDGFDVTQLVGCECVAKLKQGEDW